MTEPIRISAKNLAKMALPDFCERCFWYFLHCGTAPFNIFPSMFQHFDRSQKRSIAAYIDKYGRPPKWAGKVCAGMTGYKEVKLWKWEDKDNSIVLTGSPDALLHNADESQLVIVDYKTARYLEGKDALRPLYEAQVTIYCFLAAENGYKRPDNAALLYFEPPVDATDEELLESISDVGFTMVFSANVVDLKIGDFKPMHKYLSKARAIYDCDSPPEGREHCKDCRAIDSYIKQAEFDPRSKDKWTGRIEFWTDCEGRRKVRAICEKTVDRSQLDDEEWFPSWGE